MLKRAGKAFATISVAIIVIAGFVFLLKLVDRLLFGQWIWAIG